MATTSDARRRRPPAPGSSRPTAQRRRPGPAGRGGDGQHGVAGRPASGDRRPAHAEHRLAVAGVAPARPAWSPSATTRPPCDQDHPVGGRQQRGAGGDQQRSSGRPAGPAARRRCGARWRRRRPWSARGARAPGRRWPAPGPAPPVGAARPTAPAAPRRGRARPPAAGQRRRCRRPPRRPGRRSPGGRRRRPALATSAASVALEQGASWWATSTVRRAASRSRAARSVPSTAIVPAGGVGRPFEAGDEVGGLGGAGDDADQLAVGHRQRQAGEPADATRRRATRPRSPCRRRGRGTGGPSGPGGTGEPAGPSGPTGRRGVEGGGQAGGGGPGLGQHLDGQRQAARAARAGTA